MLWLVPAGNACAHVRVCIVGVCRVSVCAPYLYPFVSCAKSVILNYARYNLDGDTMQVALAIMCGIDSIRRYIFLLPSEQIKFAFYLLGSRCIPVSLCCLEPE